MLVSSVPLWPSAVFDSADDHERLASQADDGSQFAGHPGT
jgi:hypothetical protein